MVVARSAYRRITGPQTLVSFRSNLPSRSASRISISTPPPFPLIEACPTPTCECQDTPAGLEIDHDAPLNGTIASYAEQILIPTGRHDWKSRIEDDTDAVLVRQLKKFLGRGGKYRDPFHNVMVTNSSLPVVESPHDASQSAGDSTVQGMGSDDSKAPHDTQAPPPASAFLLPSFKYVPTIPTDDQSVERFLQGFVLPSQINAHHTVLSQEQQDVLQRQPDLQGHFPEVRNVDELLILVCGHGGRDQRCGIMGPVLCREFETKLASRGVTVLTKPHPPIAKENESDLDSPKLTARVASISHVGGHKYAGNVIIYIPPSFGNNALRGKGIWYGRVEPRHVEGIVEKTIVGGMVIRELFRGGIGQDGEALRL